MSGQLAWVACDGTLILVARPIVAPPRRRVPPEPTRRVLDAVATLMQRQPALQLLRIEAYSSHDTGQDAEHVRREIERSQARADAVFRYLWRVRGISAERLDPVGYGFQRAFKGARQRWPIVLHVAQRAAR